MSLVPMPWRWWTGRTPTGDSEQHVHDPARGVEPARAEQHVPGDPVAERGHKGHRRQRCRGDPEGVDEGRDLFAAEGAGVDLAHGGMIAAGLRPDQQVRGTGRQAMPPLAREMTRRWISDVPSKSV
jgi:hypothetical protein